ncbi:HAD family hydrolase [Photobacterium leiognathi]|uniref:HAD family hydrolase n=1 Tax=Photobacterium leiognathi TaxID=553611 RepID=UPI002981FD0F|nr:HAD family phosphatase [Photobacterium leiognathi]
MLHKYEAALFDMDGTLIDSKPAIELAWKTVAIKNGVNITSDDFEKHIHGRSGNYTLSYLFSDFTKFEQKKIKEDVDLIEESIPSDLIKGVIKTLIYLKENNVKIGLVTASWPERIKFILDYHNLHDFFSCVINRNDVINGKPDPEGFQLCAKKLKVNIENCIIFEDSFSGLEAGIRSGAKCIGINTSQVPKSINLIATYDNYSTLNSRLKI